MIGDQSDVLLATLANGNAYWTLDSRSAYHLYRDREMLFTYTTCDGGLVYMANNTPSRVVGKGSVKLLMTNWRSLTLTEVEACFEFAEKINFHWDTRFEG